MPQTNLARWAAWQLLASVVLLAIPIVAFNAGAFGSGFGPGTAGGAAPPG